jgi:hypothetical protein
MINVKEMQFMNLALLTTLAKNFSSKIRHTILPQSLSN